MKKMIFVLALSVTAQANAQLFPVETTPTPEEATLSPLLDLYDEGQAVGAARFLIKTAT